jgi:hypothetical protein
MLFKQRTFSLMAVGVWDSTAHWRCIFAIQIARTGMFFTAFARPTQCTVRCNCVLNAPASSRQALVGELRLTFSK